MLEDHVGWDQRLRRPEIKEELDYRHELFEEMADRRASKKAYQIKNIRLLHLLHRSPSARRRGAPRTRTAEIYGALGLSAVAISPSLRGSQRKNLSKD